MPATYLIACAVLIVMAAHLAGPPAAVAQTRVPNLSGMSIEDLMRPLPEPRQPLQELIRTQVVYPQEKGEWQLTVGSLADHGRASDSFAVPVGLEYGLTDAWQVGLEWDSFTHVRSRGSAVTAPGDLSFGTQYSFMNIGGSRMHAAFGLEAGFTPQVESQGERRRGREVEPYAVFAADLNRRGVQVFGQVGLAFASAEDGNEQLGKELQWNAGVLVPVGPVTFAAELDVRNETFTFRKAGELYVTPSITFTPRPSWELGFGIPIGVTSESNRVGLAVLMTYER